MDSLSSWTLRGWTLYSGGLYCGGFSTVVDSLLWWTLYAGGLSPIVDSLRAGDTLSMQHSLPAVDSPSSGLSPQWTLRAVTSILAVDSLPQWTFSVQWTGLKEKKRTTLLFSLNLQLPYSTF